MAFVPKYILILFFTIIVDYWAAIMIENSEKHKRLYLVCSIIANVGVLAVFKYFNFLNSNLSHLAHVLDWNYSIKNLSWLLPIGLSFHTFQAMSYTIEVYRGNQKAEKHLGIYALYVMFYPQLVAGPIERPQNILHQFHIKHKFDYNEVKSGLLQMCWGLLKKCVIADRLSLYVTPVFNHPSKYQGYQLIIALFFFAFQIYCDFSGYSDIALGSAKVMGFKLMTNFNYPFVSKSITEFWRRWHISLSTWFNDYLFTPLITSWRNLGKWGIVTGLFITFFLSGIWHGAGWTFIVFGILHGAALIYEFLTRKIRKKVFKLLPKWCNEYLSIFLMFSYACITWIYFRAPHINTANYIITHLFQGEGFTDLVRLKIQKGYFDFNTVIPANEFVFSLELIVLLCVFEYLQRNFNIVERIFENNKYFIVRWAVYYFAIMFFLFEGVFNNTSFIYFQF